MKSVIEKALDKVKKLNVQELDEPKPEKSKKGEHEMPIYDPRPRIYIEDKDLPAIGKYKAGDKFVLVCECSVASTYSHDRVEGKEIKKSINCELIIESIADITQG
jgi:hypothetical protein